LLHHLNEDTDHVQINELAFSPNNSNLLATAGNDGSVCIFDVPSTGLTQHVKSASLSLKASEKRLLGIDWHPLASGIFITSSADKKVSFWDVEAGGSEMLSLPSVHKDLLTNWSWNDDGSLLATHCKDKFLRVFDPRAGDSGLVGEIKDHNSPKSSHVQWMQQVDKIVTAGFSTGNDRELAVFDPRNLKARIHTEKLDPSSSTMFLFEDRDTGLLFVAGKGDGNIGFFEVTNEASFLYNVGNYKSNSPQNGLALMSKFSTKVMNCEIVRFLKLSGNRAEPIRLEVPRQQNQFFQDDLFPPTWDLHPTMSASEWANGANNPRNTVSLQPQ